MMLPYVFNGYVREIDGDDCWLIMDDLMDPTAPKEEWQVAIATLPSVPVVGQGITFTVYGENDGRWHLQPLRRWTQEEIDEIKVRAREMAKVLGI